MRIRADGFNRDPAACAGAGAGGEIANRGSVGLIGAIVRIGRFETENWIGDMAEFNQTAGLVRRALLGAVRGSGA